MERLFPGKGLERYLGKTDHRCFPAGEGPYLNGFVSVWHHGLGVFKYWSEKKSKSKLHSMEWTQCCDIPGTDRNRCNSIEVLL